GGEPGAWRRSATACSRSRSRYWCSRSGSTRAERIAIAFYGLTALALDMMQRLGVRYAVARPDMLDAPPSDEVALVIGAGGRLSVLWVSKQFRRIPGFR